jgi:hypothetical protein
MKLVPYKPVFMARELRLSEREYCQLANIVADFLRQADTKNEGSPNLKNCTVALILCEGSALSGKPAVTQETVKPKQQRSNVGAQSSANKPQRLASKHQA